MKRILGIAMVLGLVGALTVMAQEVKPESVEVIDLGKDVKLEMVLIPAGKFKMGSNKIPIDPFSNIEVKQPAKNELPQHGVTLTKPFYMSKYEVTQEQWFEIMGENPSREKGRKLPVTDVSWEDCQEFIKKLNAKTDGGYRLPTEAEWEYACRAGTTTAYLFGEEITPKDANYDFSAIGQPVAIGSYQPNAFGLYDMHGNVWEWCEDWYGDYPAGAVIDPKGPANGDVRVLRGGSFFLDESFARSSFRAGGPPKCRLKFIGLRLARTAGTKASALLTTPKSGSPVITPATKGLLVTPFTETKPKEAQKEVAKSLQKEVEDKVELGKGIKLEMVLVPAGKFMMGSHASEKGRSENQTQHEVTLTKPFYMGKYEVTQEQYEAVMGKNPSDTKGAKLPVTDVSWNDCQEFIKKLNASTKGGYRLPYEAEWEFACRAGTSTAYSFGNEITPKDANYRDSKIDKPVAIGSYQPNAFGLYDMHGNVWEWCEDWYGDYPAGAVIDPKGPGTETQRLLRGGAFNYGGSIALSSNRFNNTPSYRYFVYGFRLARTP